MSSFFCFHAKLVSAFVKLVACMVLFTGSFGVKAADIVRLGTDFNVLGAQIWIAKEKGFFEKYDIDAQIKSFALGVDTIDATLTGALDFGVGLDFATLSRLQSGQLKILSAIIEPEAGFHKLAVLQEIKQASDLAGKTIGVANATSQHLVTVNYLKNLAIDDVTLVSFSSLIEIVASMRAGRIDAAFVWGDGVAQAQDIPGVHILSDDKPANIRASGYLSTTKFFAENRPDSVENTLRALIDATLWMDDNFDEAVDIVARYARAPRDVVATQMEIQHYMIALTSSQLAGFDKIADFAADTNITRSRIEPRDFIEASFLRNIDAARVTLGD